MVKKWRGGRQPSDGAWAWCGPKITSFHLHLRSELQVAVADVHGPAVWYHKWRWFSIPWVNDRFVHSIHREILYTSLNLLKQCIFCPWINTHIKYSVECILRGKEKSLDTVCCTCTPHCTPAGSTLLTDAQTAVMQAVTSGPSWLAGR